MSRYTRYLFFKEHAGYIVGRRAEGALALARAEELLEHAEDLGVASIAWEWDDHPYDIDMPAEDVARKFESNEWTGPFGCVLRVDGDVVASLWGIVLGQSETRDPYARVVSAELASEQEDDLRQAVGDELDAQA